MADEKSKGGDKAPVPTSDPFVEIVWTLLAILLIITAINSVSAFLNKNKFFSKGWRGLTPSGLLSSVTKPISSLLNPIGSKFTVISSSADVFDSPGGKKIDTKKLGDKGTIIGGPVTKNGEKYWQVKFEDGTTGWINEKDIGAIVEKITPMKDMPSLIGTEVETNREVSVYARPGEEEIAKVPAGQKATIIEGPLIKGSKKYWHVRFDDGTEGWVSENDLDYIEESQANFVVSLLKFLNNLFSFTRFLLILVCFVLVGWIVYLVRSINRLSYEQNRILYPNPGPAEFPDTHVSNPRWDKVLSHSISQNENDWRLAIMEADIMLADLLDTMSLPGDTIGDKLKAIEKSDFLTLDNAWEAHKVRNLIAHEGMNHVITQKEVNRVIDLYKTVFEEFKVI